MTATDSTLDDRTIAELTTQMRGDSIRGPADRMIEMIGSPAAIALVSAGLSVPVATLTIIDSKEH